MEESDLSIFNNDGKHYFKLGERTKEPHVGNKRWHLGRHLWKF